MFLFWLLFKSRNKTFARNKTVSSILCFQMDLSPKKRGIRHGVKAAKRFIKDAEAEAEKKENRKLFRPVLCKELIRARELGYKLRGNNIGPERITLPYRLKHSMIGQGRCGKPMSKDKLNRESAVLEHDALLKDEDKGKGKNGEESVSRMRRRDKDKGENGEGVSRMRRKDRATSVSKETCNFYEDVEEREPDASEKMAERTGDLNSGNRSGDLNEDLEPIDYSTHGKRTQDFEEENHTIESLNKREEEDTERTAKLNKGAKRKLFNSDKFPDGPEGNMISMRRVKQGGKSASKPLSLSKKNVETAIIPEKSRKLSPEKTRQNDELPGIVGENKEIVGEENRDKRNKQNTEELSGKNGDTNMDVGEKSGNDLKDVKGDDRKKETEQSITKIVEGTGSQDLGEEFVQEKIAKKKQAEKTSPPFKLLWSCDIDEYIPSQDPYSGLKACLRSSITTQRNEKPRFGVETATSNQEKIQNSRQLSNPLLELDRIINKGKPRRENKELRALEVNNEIIPDMFPDSDLYRSKYRDQEVEFRPRYENQDLDVRPRYKDQKVENRPRYKDQELNAKPRYKDQEVEVGPRFKDQELEIRPRYKDQELDVRPRYKDQELDVRPRYKDQELDVRPRYKDQELNVGPRYIDQELEIRTRYNDQELNVRSKYNDQGLNVRPTYDKKLDMKPRFKDIELGFRPRYNDGDADIMPRFNLYEIGLRPGNRDQKLSVGPRFEVQKNDFFTRYNHQTYCNDQENAARSSYENPAINITLKYPDQDNVLSKERPRFLNSEEVTRRRYQPQELDIISPYFNQDNHLQSRYREIEKRPRALDQEKSNYLDIENDLMPRYPDGFMSRDSDQENDLTSSFLDLGSDLRPRGLDQENISKRILHHLNQQIWTNQSKGSGLPDIKAAPIDDDPIFSFSPSRRKRLYLYSNPARFNVKSQHSDFLQCFPSAPLDAPGSTAPSIYRGIDASRPRAAYDELPVDTLAAAEYLANTEYIRDIKHKYPDHLF
ncbi:uncharacterized protein LOC111699351 isoform X4 [Eurytemora carolleeae]|uniref:uncharacterized protein LOC111699351 isoform X4 n=1 Tax=Eurytemora carolleeae TaxID=1294199 RepID=UPI000C774B21|nr:uncharacterized protein LOC111699351 isoform X4 [Eurytemora carolleeae]|eukprot:XP_023325772.1 uncharacterized protein LOC111699351 isoform X4 [Eurytemora affinis]